MTKRQQITALLNAGKTQQEIAAVVGCHESYVRTVKQRNAGVDYTRAYHRRIDKAGRNRPDAVEFARKVGQDVYRAAIASGLSHAKACSKSGGARSLALRKYVVNNSTPT